MDGPLNYLGSLYRAIPIGITVEGANILTQNLIIFGQGAIRCHPYLMEEMLALQDPDRERGLARFDGAFWRHVGHSLATFARAWWRAWTGALFAPAPQEERATPFYRGLSRYAAAFALVSDMALLTLGGTLKRREMLSARLGDILSELFLLSAVLKRWHDEGRQADDLPLVAFCTEDGFATIEARLDEVLRHLPNRPVAWLTRLAVLPFGVRRRGPSDKLTVACAEILLEPSAARDRLTSGLFLGRDDEGIARLERAFALVASTSPVRTKLRVAGITDWRAARESGLLTAEDSTRFEAMEAAVHKLIVVDDFPAEALSPSKSRPEA
jgi:acyl-CoA dehydrogenase